MLIVLGRKDQIIKISGQRVDLNYVSSCISKIKEVNDVVVIPIKHQIIGIIPFAIIVKKKEKNLFRFIKKESHEHFKTNRDASRFLLSR